MARGLPVVVSDWDGYRDSVRDGVDGFRIPTVMPAPGGGADLARHYALGFNAYDQYCACTSQLIGVDIEATANALRRLFLSVPLRRQMGVVGAERVHNLLDWSVIIPQYQALWAELAGLRSHAEKSPARPHPWPARNGPLRRVCGIPYTPPDALDTALSHAG